MKRNTLFSSLCLNVFILLLATMPALASSQTNWSNIQTSTIAQALTLPDDTRVILEGTITSLNRHERYELRDATGTVVVDIDDDLWRGQRFVSGQKVRIFGEVDVKSNRIEIDASRVEVVSATNSPQNNSGWGSLTLTTIAKAITLPDDTQVILEGTVTPLNRRERYELRDATGTVVVDIDDDIMGRAPLAKGQRIRVFGEVDIKRNSIEIDANRIEIIQ
ncbi:NirD/YgiW/YdeI family stress tolerance protein [Desulfovibrio litoralis]|uniref:TIGR00156 family protein n=1 Tax=Desulfovibrio litoralis DSM 11393 TaxID=1121455 RepID=A0A1M7SPZ0_9BACT|nr:NirD/YgiW/YdeI family stress tolerance protein [Desulfovibrio litoralis]SHN60469.1 TIGR00156 family protein [Desulfovibrio litoralis DSM 11393]